MNPTVICGHRFDVIKNDYFSNIKTELDQLKEDIGFMKYKNVPIFGIVKIPVWSLIRSQYLMGNNDTLPWLKEHFWAIKEILKLFVYKVVKSAMPFQNLVNKNTIFVIDHDILNFVNLQVSLLERFDYSQITIITASEPIFHNLKSRYKEIFFVGELEKSETVRYSHLLTLYKVIRNSCFIRSQSLLFKLIFSLHLLKAMKRIDFYSEHLEKAKFDAVITLNDVQAHEFVISTIANMKGISTFTLQHGIIGVNHTPVVSDKIFVWGEETKRNLIDFNVPKENIVVSGKPDLNEAVRKYRNDRTHHLDFIIKQYGIPTDTPIVTFIAGANAPQRNLRLLECFLHISDLDTFLIIKLKPNTGNDEIEQIRTLLKQSSLGQNIPLLIYEDLYEILALTDILIAFNSSVVVEAFPFSVVCIILDIFEHDRLNRVLPHYKDCLIARSSKELQNVVCSLVKNSSILQDKKLHFEKISKKYFFSPQNKDSLQIIHDCIVSSEKEAANLRSCDS